MAIQIKHPTVTGRPISHADWDGGHLLTGTPGKTIQFDSSGNAVEVDPATGSGTIPTVPTLAILSLSSTALTSGTSTSGIILGATVGSTLVGSNLPTGFTINSAARTWAFDGSATAGTPTITLTETLAGATGSPKATNIGLVISAAPTGTLDSTLSTPFLVLTASNTDGSSPTIDVDLQPDYAVGDTIRVYRRSKSGALIQTYSHTITLPEATDTSAGTSGKATLGLSAVPAGTWRFTADVLKAGGATYGPLSNQIVEGPDDIEPVLTSPATPSNVQSTSMIVGATTDTPEGVFYAVLTTANTAPTALQVQNGQNAAGASTPNANVAVTSIGAKTVTVTGLTASTTYYIWYMHKDVAGNFSTVLSGGSQPSASPGFFAKLVTGTGTTGSADANQYMPSTDGYTATMNNTPGAPSLIKSTDAPPAKFHFEMTINTVVAGSAIFIGVTDSADAVGPSIFNRPGNSGAQKGFTFELGQGGTINYPYYNGTGGSAGTTAAIAAGLIFAIEVDTTTNTLVVKQKSSGTVSTIMTVTLTSQIPTNYRAFVGGKVNTDSVTVNFGASAWAITPTTGFTGW